MAAAEESVPTSKQKPLNLSPTTIEDAYPRTVSVNVERDPSMADPFQVKSEESRHDSGRARRKAAHKHRQRLAKDLRMSSVPPEKLRAMPKPQHCPELVPLLEQWCRNIDALRAKIPLSKQPMWERSQQKELVRLRNEELKQRSSNIAQARWEVTCGVDKKTILPEGTPDRDPKSKWLKSARFVYKGIAHGQEVSKVYYFIYRASDTKGPVSKDCFYCIYGDRGISPESLRDVPLLSDDSAKDYEREVKNRAAVCYFEEQALTVHGSNFGMREQLKLHKMVEMMRNAIDLDDPSAAAKLFMGAKKNAIALLKANGVSEETADEIEAKVAELMFGDPCALLPRTVCHIKINFNDGGLQIVPGNDAHNSAPEAKKAVRATIEQAKLLQDLALRAKFAASPQEQERFLQIIKECSAQFATEVEDGEE